MIALILHGFLISLGTQPRWEADRLQVGGRGAAHLFDGQQLAGGDVVRGGELLTHAGAEELAQDGAVQVAMDALPAAALEVVQPEFLLGFPKAVFDIPASEGDAQQIAERPAAASRHAVTQEVLDLVGHDVAGDEQRMLTADQSLAVGSPPAGVPLDFPNVGTVAGVFDAVTLGTLVVKGGRVPP